MQATKENILDLEKKFWTAMRDNDVQTMTDLTDDECILVGPQGISRFRNTDFEKMNEQATYKLRNFEIDDGCEVTILNDETAVIAYKVKEDLDVDGESLTLEASESSTWVRRGDKWVCSLHAESIVGDPFGRDKKEMGSLQ